VPPPPPPPQRRRINFAMLPTVGVNPSTTTTHSATALGCFLTLFVAAAGAGLLSYPFAVQQQGMAVCAASTLVFALITVYTDLILVQSAALFRDSTLMGGSRTYEALVDAALGRRLAAVAGATVIIGSLGALIGYLIIIGDSVCGPLASALGCGGGGGGSASAAACAAVSRPVLIPLFALLVLLPLSALPTLSRLGHSSALATLTVLAVCGIVVAPGVAALRAGGLVVVPLARGPPADDAPAALVLARAGAGALVPFMLAVPISVFSLGNHLQIVPAFLEAPRGGGAARAFPAAVAAAVSACVALYLFTGELGYVAFRTGTDGDAILNLPADAATAVGKALLALHLLAAYPVLLFPARSSLTALAAAGAARAAERGAPPVIVRALAAAAASPLPAAAALTAVAALCAVALPQVAIVFGAVGATASTFQIHTVPGLLLLRWARAAASLGGGGGSGGGGGGGDAAAALREATWAGALDAWREPPARRGDEDRPLLKAAAEDGGDDGDAAALEPDAAATAATADVEAPPPRAAAAAISALSGRGGGDESAALPRVLPLHSPRLLYASGVALIALSLAIAVIGTAAFAYSLAT